MFFQLKEGTTISEVYFSARTVSCPAGEYLFSLSSGLTISLIEDRVGLVSLPFKYVKRYRNNSDLTTISRRILSAN